MAKVSFRTTVGALTLWADDAGLTRLDWAAAPGGDDAGGMLGAGRAQILQYLAGERTEFDLPLSPGGTEFLRGFYQALCAIPYGETRTYGDLAGELGVPAQAIGQACGGNPLPIVIPCHRVLAADGLGGYSGGGGIETKVALLRLEGAASLLI